MKAYNFCIIFTFLLLAFACKKKEEDSIINFKALKDGKNWIPTNSWALLSKTDKKLMIHADKRDPKYFQDENLYLSFYISDISEFNTVKNFYSDWNYVIGGDGVSNSYKFYTNPENVIQIISLDTVNKQISGRFNVKLLRDKFYSDKVETMYFTDGQFQLAYQEAYIFNFQPDK
jgi:hypothetical protein